MLKMNNEYKVDWYDYKERTMENYSSEVNRESDTPKKMELDWTHITQRSKSNTENHIRLESSGV